MFRSALRTGSRKWALPVIAFPFSVLAALIGQVDVQFTAAHRKVEMEIFSAGFNAHKPLVVRHLLQMDRSAMGDDFAGSGPAVCQLALSSDLIAGGCFEARPLCAGPFAPSDDETREVAYNTAPR